MTYLELRLPENYFQSMRSCDDADAREIFNAQLSKKERKKMRKRRKMKEHLQHEPQSSHEYKIVKIHELEEPFPVKTVSNPALNADKPRETHTVEGTSDIKVAYNDAEGKHGTNKPNDQKATQITNKKNLVREEAQTPQGTAVLYENIIEKLIENLSKPAEDSIGSKDNLTNALRKVKQRKKNRNRRKRIQNIRQKDKTENGNRRRKNTSSVTTLPPKQTLKHLIPTQSIINDQKEETHFHFYISDHKPSLNPAMLEANVERDYAR